MDREQLRAERPEHKVKNTYFVDGDGVVWHLFGATEEWLLACRCYFSQGCLCTRAMNRLPYNWFAAWCERSAIIEFDGQATIAAAGFENANPAR